MKKALSLLIVVCFLLVTMVACIPEKGDEVPSDSVNTTAKPSASTDKPSDQTSWDDETESKESQTSEGQNQPKENQGGLEVSSDSETGWGPLKPLS